MGVVKYGAQDEAKELAYDNASTGLAATTIQQAIDLLHSTKEPANSNILKTTNIGVSVQAYNANLTGINQALATTSNPTFGDVLITSLNVNNNLSVTSDGTISGAGFDSAVTTLASGLVTTHEAASNPHPTYLTAAEADAAYAEIAHIHATGNLITVSKVAGPNEYSTIAAAIAAATSGTPSTTNRYVIQVLPGEYTESPFTIPAYVYVSGLDPWNSAVIKTNDLTNDFITISPNGGLFNTAVSGPTTSGKSAVKQVSSGTTKLYWVNIKEGYYGITLAPTSGAARCHCIAVVTDGPTTMNRMFNCDNPVGVGIFILMLSGPMVTTWVGTAPAALYLNSDGGSVPKANATIDLCQFRGNAPSGGTLYDIYADNGALVRGISCSFAGATSLTNTRIAICSGPNAGGTHKTKIDIHGSQIKPGGYTKDIKVQSADSINSFSGTATEANLDFVANTKFNGSFSDSSFGQVIYGELYVGNTSNKTPLSSYVEADKSTGAISGGGLSRGVGTREVDVAAGSGFLDTTNGLRKVTWNGTTVTIAANSANVHICVNNTGTVTVSYTPTDKTLNVHLGEVSTNADSVVFLSDQHIILPQFRPALASYFEKVVGPINVSGGVVTNNAGNGLKMDVTESTFFVTEDELTSAYGTAISFYHWSKDGLGGWTVSSPIDTVSPDHYDDGSGTPATLPATKWIRSSLFVAVNSGSTDYHVVCSQEYFDTEPEADVDPIPPDLLRTRACRLASLVAQKDATTMTILDARPRLGQMASGHTGITNHNDMGGRDSATAHSQYQLISQKGNADGYASLDGSGKVPSGQIPTIAHGDQSGGTLHAAASTSVAGFMSGADKTKLDGIATGATVYADENAQDAVATAIAAGTHAGVTVTYNDASNSLSFTSLIKSVYAGNLAATSGTSTITPGTGVPLSTAGTQLWSQAITPKSTGSNFMLRCSLTIGASTTGSTVTVTVYRGTTYIGSALVRADANGDTDGIVVDIVDAPATTSPVTYSCRIGITSGTWYINRRSNELTYGGTNSGWSIMEY